MVEGFPETTDDSDPQETSEWLEAIEELVGDSGEERAAYLIDRLVEFGQLNRIGVPSSPRSPYINTISPTEEPPYPGDRTLEGRIRQILRWNAALMVVRANTDFDGIGGHISSYASAASLYEVAFNHHFRGPDDRGGGDQVFFQGHASPGIYARAFLEGRLNETQLDHFRREGGDPKGLSSYPHPRLMPEFWQFPTVSMGLGAINAIYQARFNRYLHNRGFKDTSSQRVWAFLGDGECDEPESLGALSIAARENLDNLTFVINCNLQRLDGPVRGNGKVIQELEGIFSGAGWRVLKVIWSSDWDPIFSSDTDHQLIRRLGQILDGEFQRFEGEEGAWIREQIAAGDQEITRILASTSDEDLKGLRRGGHDVDKIHAAYSLAASSSGQPTVILAKTMKGWKLGPSTQSRNINHQIKKMSHEDLLLLRDTLEIPLSDEQVEKQAYFHPGAESREVKYLLERREALGGSLPQRRVQVEVPGIPSSGTYTKLHEGTGPKLPASTTMAFARLFRELLKDKSLGPRIVPIIADEARTFGMEPLFKQVGIYASHGQKYQPIDHQMLFSYSERQDGQILEEGISECGSLASFIAAGSSYSTHGEVMLPFYIFYSMFGFQRVGDQIWALGDMRGRGFLLGATAGRTTLNGEGLQHQDGHSLLQASAVPCCVSYDPAYAYEVAVIIEEGIRRMVQEQEDVFYYITLYNENLEMPAMPEGSREGILAGLYPVRKSPGKRGPRVRLLGSGPALAEVLKAAAMLQEDYGVRSEVYSATSYQQLRRNALTVERWNRLNPTRKARTSVVEEILGVDRTPVVAVSDFMKAIPDQIERWVKAPWTSLGTDGFGMSDTREVLRRFFEVDAQAITHAALFSLYQAGKIERKTVLAARKRFSIDPEKTDPTSR